MKKDDLIINKLSKGDYLSATTLKSDFEINPENALHLLAVKALIEKETKFTAKIEGGGVRILTDDEASEYNNKHFINSLERAKYRDKKLNEVTIKLLDKETQRIHLHRINVQGKILQSIEIELRKFYPINISVNQIPKIFDSPISDIESIG